LTQKAVAERLCRGDGRKVLPPWLNDLEHDRRYPPENAVIEQIAEILNISADVLYFYARRVPGDISGDFADNVIEAGYRAFRKEQQRPATIDEPWRQSRGSLARKRPGVKLQRVDSPRMLRLELRKSVARE
jgi:transcriptional regulator with XRE-family HTH domain